MPKRTVFSGAGTPIVWSGIFARRLTTVRGMWQAMQALPALPRACRV